MVKSYYMCELCDTGHPNKEDAEVCEDACRKENQQKKDEREQKLKKYHVVSDVIVNSYAVITCCGCGKTFQIPCSCEYGHVGRPYRGFDDDGLACPRCDTVGRLDEDETATFFANWADN